MVRYPEGGWTGDPILDGSLWSLGVPLNGETILLEAEQGSTALVVDVMDRAIERGVPIWRLTTQPRGDHLIVESRRTIMAFLDALGWEEPPDHRFEFVEIAVDQAGRTLPEQAPEAFVAAFLAARLREGDEGSLLVEWPAPAEDVEAFLSDEAITFSVPEAGVYRFPEPEQVPGYERYRRHSEQQADASVFAILDVWPPLREEQPARYGNEAIRERLDELV